VQDTSFSPPERPPGTAPPFAGDNSFCLGEILGHSVGGITYRHDAHRAPLAFRAIMTLPQPSAFSAILRGGQRVPVLPEAVRRRRLTRSIRPTRARRPSDVSVDETDARSLVRRHSEKPVTFDTYRKADDLRNPKGRP
jgi:hypothetical protein